MPNLYNKLVIRYFLFRTKKSKSFIDMVDLRYNIIGFLGVIIDKSKTFFVEVNSIVKKGVLILLGKYFCLMYFHYRIRIKSIKIWQVAFDFFL